jgi:hypothetical protein
MAADVVLNEDQVTVDGRLIATVRIKWGSAPQDIGLLFMVPPMDTESDVPLAAIIGNIVSLVMDARARILRTQAGWRWCHKCEGMFFAGRATKGVCPSDQKPHSTDGSSAYEMPYR